MAAMDIAELEFWMHCPACGKDVKKICERTKGVALVDIEDLGDGKGVAIVKGVFDVEEVVKRLAKAKKFVTILTDDDS